MKIWRMLFIAGTLLLGLMACQAPATTGVDVTLTFDNIGASAWQLTEVTGATGVGELEQDNPSLALSVGSRYRIINNGGENHPFELLGQDATGTVILLSQSSEGSLEADAEIMYEEDSSGITFTLTQVLADQLSQYRCGIHVVSMLGDISSN